MTRLKVAVALGDTTGVSHYRLKWPAQAVAEETGWDVRTYRHDQIAVAETPGRYLVKGLDLEGLDLFVMSRPPALKHVRMLSHLQRLGVGVVVDMDDDLSQVHRRSSSWAAWNGRRTHWRYALSACSLADVVTCSTRAIERRFAKHGRYAILNNRIPADLIAPKIDAKDGPFTILWSGSAKGHEGDLEAMGQALKGMDDIRVRVVGPGDKVASRLGIREDQVSATGWTPFEDWHEVLAREAALSDVGIVPLGGTRFNQAKSWLKGMEFLNVGLPVIASPTAEYLSLASRVPGQVSIVGTREMWRDRIRAAQACSAANPRQRVHEAAQRAFIAAAGSLSLSAGTGGWVDAWQRAVSRREGLKR